MLPPRLSIEDQPPPYTEESLPPPAKPEALPEYSTRSPEFSPVDLPTRPGTTIQAFIRRRWLYILLVLVILAGTIAGGVAKYLIDRHPSIDRDPPNPLIVSLAATECDAGYFIFHQDNTGDIYLQGSLRNGTWNQTNSNVIPKTKVEIPVHKTEGVYTEPDEYVMYGANLTAVCWSEPASIEIRIYYLSEFYYINEASLSLTSPGARFPSYPVNLTATHQQIVNVTNPSSMAAIRHSVLGTRVYYLDSPLGYWDGVKGYKTANVTEISWQNDQMEINILKGVAHDSGAALAAVAVDTNQGAKDEELWVLYINPDKSLEILRWGNESWGHGEIPVPTRGPNNISPPQLTSPTIVSQLSAAVWVYNPTSLWVAYIQDHRPKSAEIYMAPENASALSFELENQPTELPDAIQYPGLVASTTWRDNYTSAFTNLSQFQDLSERRIWYVQRSEGGGHGPDDVGVNIVNATDKGVWGYDTSTTNMVG